MSGGFVRSTSPAASGDPAAIGATLPIMRPPNYRRQELIWAFARAARVDIEIAIMRGCREITPSQESSPHPVNSAMPHPESQHCVTLQILPFTLLYNRFQFMKARSRTHMKWCRSCRQLRIGTCAYIPRPPGCCTCVSATEVAGIAHHQAHALGMRSTTSSTTYLKVLSAPQMSHHW